MNTLISIPMTNESQELLQKLGRSNGIEVESEEKTGLSNIDKNEERAKCIRTWKHKPRDTSSGRDRKSRIL